MYAITLDLTGKELFREERKNRSVPRNGFEKRIDGNFYKVLGDPRCISFFEAKEKLLKAEKEAKEKEEQKLLPPPLPVGSASENKKGRTITYTANYKVFFGSFLSGIAYRGYYMSGVGEHMVHNYTNAFIQTQLNIEKIDKLKELAKIEVYHSKNRVVIWEHSRATDPDFVINGLFRTG